MRRRLSDQATYLGHLTGLKRFRHPNGRRYRRPFWILGRISAEARRVAREIATEFDPGFYLASNGDVQAARLDPLLHYVIEGWKELRDPNANFSTSAYLAANPDVGALRVNPFWHYIVSGRSEGRSWSGKDPRADLIRQLSTIADLEMAALATDQMSATLDAGRLRSILSEVGSADILYIAVSQDSYKIAIGGIQLCLQLEEKAVMDDGGAYLHLFPINKRSWLSRASNENLLLGVNLNGAFVGTSFADDLLSVLGETVKSKSILVIHSMLGQSPTFMVQLNNICTETPIYWNHDHSSICVSYNLRRNMVASCGGPPLSSVQCKMCVFGEERGSHLAHMKSIFSALNPIVVSPSAFAKRYWEDRTDYRHAKSIVLEHCRIGPAEPKPVRSGAARVAFVGTPASSKGWDVFTALASKHANDARYEFRGFGRHRPAGTSIQWHDVSVLETGPTAMSDALAEANIDIAFLWSLCPETFSFTAFETISAGASIITNGQSGNIANLVENTGLGTVYSTDRELFEAFDTGTVLQLVARRRQEPERFPLIPSGMTAEIVKGLGR
ncbi:hypothetical protein [Mesorhizobium sp.]|jgi:hypothetical protein|uniref:hypothetical protein n=1 Tax=Mesorhizobium sp. TaxID=1871066 RepID=UPI003568F66F